MLPLNPENPRIIVPLFAPALGALAAQAAAAAAAPEADLVELRLDPLPVPDYAAALDLVRRVVAKPLIVTVRTAGEGGRAALDPAAYGAALTGLLARGGVDALDIEWRAGTALTARLRDAAHAAGAAALFSEHHFAGTPPVDAMEQTLTGMLDAGADIAKLAVMPRRGAAAAGHGPGARRPAGRGAHHHEHGPGRRGHPLLRRGLRQRSHLRHAGGVQRPRPAPRRAAAAETADRRGRRPLNGPLFAAAPRPKTRRSAPAERMPAAFLAKKAAAQRSPPNILFKGASHGPF